MPSKAEALLIREPESCRNATWRGILRKRGLKLKYSDLALAGTLLNTYSFTKPHYLYLPLESSARSK